MARPETYEELRSFEKADIPLAEFQEADITGMRDIELISHMFKFLHRAEELGLIVEDPENAGALKISRQKTEKEKDQSLRSEQASWDRIDKWYFEAKNGKISQSHFNLQGVLNSHAKREGYEPLELTQEDIEETQN